MSVIGVDHDQGSARRERASPLGLAPGIANPLMIAVVVAAFASGVLATDAASAAKAAGAAGDDLTRLMRFMAAIKASMAAAAGGAVFWRLGHPVGLPRFLAYGLTCGAMAAGPGLIWNMAHVGLGALLLHVGLIATVLLLWRDPAVADGLQTILTKRRLLGGRRPPTARARTPADIDRSDPRGG